MTGPNGAAAPLRIAEDTGLGYCLRCVMQYKTGQRQQRPEFAITQAPVMVPVADPMGNIAGMVPATVPACYDHVGDGKKAGGAALIVAGGSLS